MISTMRNVKRTRALCLLTDDGRKKLMGAEELFPRFWRRGLIHGTLAALNLMTDSQVLSGTARVWASSYSEFL